MTRLAREKADHVAKQYPDKIVLGADTIVYFDGQIIGKPDTIAHAREILRMRDELNGILVKHTGQEIDTIIKDTDRDNFMSATEAKAYGLIDDVIVSRTELPKNGIGAEDPRKNDNK